MPNVSGTDRAQSTLAYLRRMISTGAWPLNSRIPTEPELMESLGVGKSTVREAVRSLASLGMLETLRGRGTYVRATAPVTAVLTEYLADYDVAEVLAARRALEIEAARLAALNSTPEQRAALRAAYEAATGIDDPTRLPGEFHTRLFEAAGGTLLPALFQALRATLKVASVRGTVVHGASDDIRGADHLDILLAIEAGDADAAARLMAGHCDRDLVPATPSDEPRSDFPRRRIVRVETKRG